MKILKRFWQAMVFIGAFYAFVFCIKNWHIGVFEYVALFMFIANIAAEFFCVQE